MKKYENIDVVDALGAVVELNTKHYRDDFGYDIEMFRKAAKAPYGENNYLLWMSRRSGTECFLEREVYIRESGEHNSWVYYADRDDETFVAFAVEILGTDDDRVLGNLYEMDYREHARRLKREALSVATVSVRFEDEIEAELTYSEYKHYRHREHGRIVQRRFEPNDADELRALLRDVRAERRGCAPAAFDKINYGGLS